MDDKILTGLIGTAVSATGAGLSVTELQAIISIIVTVAGFIISVLVPLCIKLYKKIKAAKEDGKIDAEEVQDILDTTKEIIDATAEQVSETAEDIKEIKEKK